MRVNFSSVELPMRFAHAIRFLFPALKLSTAQEWAAKLFFYRNWHELQKSATDRTRPATPIWSREWVDDNGEPELLFSTDAKLEQQSVLYTLTDGTADPANCLYQMYQLAREGVKCAAVDRHAPLFSVLHERRWFAAMLDSTGQVIGEDIELDTGLGARSYSVRVGFPSRQKALHWAKKAGHHLLLSQITSRESGGTWYQIDDQSSPNVRSCTAIIPVWLCGDNNRMAGGAALTLTMTAFAAEPWRDNLDVCVSHAWHDVTKAEAEGFGSAMGGGIYVEVMSACETYMTLSTGRKDVDRLRGRITIRGEGSSYADEAAQFAHDVSLDFLSDSGFAQAGHFLGDDRRGTAETASILLSNLLFPIPNIAGEPIARQDRPA